MDGSRDRLARRGPWVGNRRRGYRAEIESVFETIQCDPRHHTVTVLHFKSTDRRSFANWSMAYAGIATPETAHCFATGVLDNPDAIEGGQGGTDLVTVLQNLIGRHDAAHL